MRIRPGASAVIRSHVMQPWCHLVNDAGITTDEQLEVPDFTHCVVFSDKGESVGATFLHEGSLRSGLFERQYIFLRA
jgi:hypothetical protein